MEKKKEHVINQLNYIKSWANDILVKSKKMEKILQDIDKSNPELSDYMMFIDIGDPKYGADLLISDIDDAIDEIVNS